MPPLQKRDQVHQRHPWLAGRCLVPYSQWQPSLPWHHSRALPLPLPGGLHLQLRLLPLHSLSAASWPQWQRASAAQRGKNEYARTHFKIVFLYKAGLGKLYCLVVGVYRISHYNLRAIAQKLHSSIAFYISCNFHGNDAP